MKVRNSQNPVVDVTTLPIWAKNEEIKAALNDPTVHVVIINVPTGGGKTLGLPVMLEHMFGVGTLVLMTEPYRTATQEAYDLLSGMLQQPLGIRLGGDRGANYDPRVNNFLIATQGAGLHELNRRKWKFFFGDEFDDDQHGFGLSVHHHLIQRLRATQTSGEVFKVVLMSATPDIPSAMKFYGDRGFNVQVIESGGRAFDPTVVEHQVRSYASFREFLPEYLRVVVEEIRNNLPAGENMLLTIPSPTYFDEIRRLIAQRCTDLTDLEIVTFWSKTPDEEKKRILRGGNPEKRTIVLCTDSMRRGTTPDAFTTIPSGWQTRMFYDQVAGMLGKREELSAIPEQNQDEGRVARNKAGRVIRFVDDRRPAHILGIFERSPIHNVLLNILSQGINLEKFEWYVQIPPSVYQRAVEDLLNVGAIVNEGQYLALTEKGKMMQRLQELPWNQSSEVYEASRFGVTAQMLVARLGMSVGLFVNAKDNQVLADKQKMLTEYVSDFEAYVNAWVAVVSGFRLGEVIRIAQNQFDREVARLEKEFGYDSLRVSEYRLRREDIVRDAITDACNRHGGRVADQYGLYRHDVSKFVLLVYNTVRALEYADFDEGDEAYESRITTWDEVLSLTTVDAYTSRFMAQASIASNPHYLWVKNGRYDYSCVLPRIIEAGSIHPGSLVFSAFPPGYVFGMPLLYKSNGSERVYLTGVVAVTMDDIVAAIPHLLSVSFEDPEFTAFQGGVYAVRRVTFGSITLKSDWVRLTNDEAVRVLAKAIVEGRVRVDFVNHNNVVIVEIRELALRAPKLVKPVTDDQLIDWYVAKLGTATSVAELTERMSDFLITGQDAADFLGVRDYPTLRERIGREFPEWWTINGLFYRIQYNGESAPTIHVSKDVVSGLGYHQLPAFHPLIIQLNDLGYTDILVEVGEVGSGSLTRLRTMITERDEIMADREVFLVQLTRIRALRDQIDWSESGLYGFTYVESLFSWGMQLRDRIQQIERILLRTVYSVQQISEVVKELNEAEGRLTRALAYYTSRRDLITETRQAIADAYGALNGLPNESCDRIVRAKLREELAEANSLFRRDDLTDAKAKAQSLKSRCGEILVQYAFEHASELALAQLLESEYQNCPVCGGEIYRDVHFCSHEYGEMIADLTVKGDFTLKVTRSGKSQVVRLTLERSVTVRRKVHQNRKVDHPADLHTETFHTHVSPTRWKLEKRIDTLQAELAEALNANALLKQEGHVDLVLEENGIGWIGYSEKYVRGQKVTYAYRLSKCENDPSYGDEVWVFKVGKLIRDDGTYLEYQVSPKDRIDHIPDMERELAKLKEELATIS